MTIPSRGRFITFEGIDGAGKSTHIRFAAEFLHSLGKQVVATREPGGTPLGEQLRAIVLNETMHLETETLLMFASRREHLAQVIEPALARGDWVVSDRFTDASFAYQGGGRSLALEKLERLEQWVHPHLQPDLTFLFDVPTHVARERLHQERHLDRFEQEKEDFFSRTRDAYLKRAQDFPHRFRVVDSTQPKDQVKKLIEEFITSI